MNKEEAYETQQTRSQDPTDLKKSWKEPKLAFIEPKLTPHGELEQVTGAFFGTFTP